MGGPRRWRLLRPARGRRLRSPNPRGRTPARPAGTAPGGPRERAHDPCLDATDDPRLPIHRRESSGRGTGRSGEPGLMSSPTLAEQTRRESVPVVEIELGDGRPWGFALPEPL